MSLFDRSNHIWQILSKRVLLILFLTLYFAFSYFTYKDYGLTMDEFFVYTRGDYFYHKVVGNDALLQKGFVVKEDGNENLLYYNSTYPALLFALNNDRSYEGYHLWNLLFSSALFILIYELLLRSYGTSKVAILGPVFLFLTPRLFGHIPTNPKDIPYATAYLASLVAISFRNSLPRNVSMLVIGITIGITASFRLLGLSLVPIYVLHTVFSGSLTKLLSRKSKLIETVGEILIISLLAFLTLMMSIPYIGADPFNHTLELLRVNSVYPWRGTVLFLGNLLDEMSIPLQYLPVWLAITTPVFIMVFLFVSLFIKKSKKIMDLFTLIGISLSFQVVLYAVLQPVIYNGLRHYIFLLPHFVILSIIGLVEVWRRFPRWKWFVACAVGINAMSIIYYYVLTYPFLYPYFNLFARSVPGITKQFDFDYWATSDKEALAWLKNYLGTTSGNPKIYMCSKSMSLPYYFPEAIDSNDDIGDADFVVCHDEIEFQDIKEDIRGTILHQVTRDGRVYNTVYKVTK